VNDPHFENGVVKIQNGDSAKLTEGEIEAVQSLRVDNDVADADNAPDVRSMSPASYATAVRSKRQRIQTVRRQECYINCNYILGSVAEVERLWKSLASYGLHVHGSTMNEANLEDLLFLKMNSEFWDVDTVDQACRVLGI
jgi:hypothetical protein